MEDSNIAPIPTNAPNQSGMPPKPAFRKPYPGSIGAMIMGIIAVILCWYSVIPFAGFFFFIPSLILGIIAYSRGKKYFAALQLDPEAYAKPSAAFLKAARITGLISVIAGPVMLLFSIILMIVGGTDSMF